MSEYNNSDISIQATPGGVANYQCIPVQLKNKNGEYLNSDALCYVSCLSKSDNTTAYSDPVLTAEYVSDASIFVICSKGIKIKTPSYYIAATFIVDGYSPYTWYGNTVSLGVAGTSSQRITLSTTDVSTEINRLELAHKRVIQFMSSVLCKPGSSIDNGLSLSEATNIAENCISKRYNSSFCTTLVIPVITAKGSSLTDDDGVTRAETYSYTTYTSTREVSKSLIIDVSDYPHQRIVDCANFYVDNFRILYIHIIVDSLSDAKKITLKIIDDNITEDSGDIDARSTATQWGSSYSNSDWYFTTAYKDEQYMIFELPVSTNDDADLGPLTNISDGKSPDTLITMFVYEMDI